MECAIVIALGLLDKEGVCARGPIGTPLHVIARSGNGRSAGSGGSPSFETFAYRGG